MQLIIFLLVAVLLFGMSAAGNVYDGTGTVEVDMPDDTTEVDTETDTTDGDTDETTEEDTDTDMPLVGNTYDLVIDGEGLNMTFESDGSLTIGEFMEAYDGNYEITDEFLYVNIIHTYYDETVALELTYDDLTLDVVSGMVNTYELITDDSDISEEELAEFNAQYTGVPYTLELTSGQ